MTWSITNLILQVVCGILGGNVSSGVAKEHEFGIVGHTIVGAFGGAFGGVFLQTLIATVVLGDGSPSTSTSPLEQYVLQALSGIVMGGIAVLAVGIIKHVVDEHRRSSS